VSLGLPDGLLVVAWPSMRGTFCLPLEALGPLLAGFTTGYVVSSFAAGPCWLERRRSPRGELFRHRREPVRLRVGGRLGSRDHVGRLGGIGAGAIDSGVNA
jgi:hypothetical protein